MCKFLMKPSTVFVVPVFAAILACGVQFASASAIQWSTGTPGGTTGLDISTDADVSTLGTYVYGIDWNGSAGNVTVNGVPFTGTIGSSTDVTVNGSNAGGSVMSAASSLDASYKGLVGGCMYYATSVTLNGLNSGDQYEVQVWANDSRSGTGTGTHAQSFLYSTGGGNEVSLWYDVTLLVGGTGQYTIGTFTADGTGAQTFYYANSPQFINAVLVRDLTAAVPEPARSPCLPADCSDSWPTPGGSVGSRSFGVNHAVTRRSRVGVSRYRRGIR